MMSLYLGDNSIVHMNGKRLFTEHMLHITGIGEDQSIAQEVPKVPHD